MRRNYVELQQFLQANFPELREPGAVRGELFNPPSWALALAQAGQLVQMCGMGLALGGGFLFGTLGLPEPPFQPFIQANRVGVVIGLFFLNSLASSFVATGAFEVTVDGELVFSKLREGAFPTGEFIMQALQSRGLHLA
ncbi:unnamed protein product [Discosporangium mesarthrocarpum]